MPDWPNAQEESYFPGDYSEYQEVRLFFGVCEGLTINANARNTKVPLK